MFQNNSKFIILNIFLFSFFISCDKKPKVISANNDQVSTSQNLVSDPNGKNSNANSEANTLHKIVVKEVLNTSKYSYLRVEENNEEYWIAILKREITIGETYTFQGGILKRNFYSQEYDRIFDKVYLVSGISDASGKKTSTTPTSSTSPKVDIDVSNINLAEGAVKISNIIQQKDKYANKHIKITGKCVKLNPNIMNRNWVHISDGSGQNLVVTTNEVISLGALVNLEGTISLDRDFGAGYKYDIIMEGAVLK